MTPWLVLLNTKRFHLFQFLLQLQLRLNRILNINKLNEILFRKNKLTKWDFSFLPSGTLFFVERVYCTIFCFELIIWFRPTWRLMREIYIIIFEFINLIIIMIKIHYVFFRKEKYIYYVRNYPSCWFLGFSRVLSTQKKRL